jgi:uncharacterized membrane protein YtjA (UPF0391 family)
MATLRTLAIAFIIITFAAWILGARGTAGFSWGIAKFLIVVFVVLFVISVFVGGVLNI